MELKPKEQRQRQCSNLAKNLPQTGAVAKICFGPRPDKGKPAIGSRGDGPWQGEVKARKTRFGDTQPKGFLNVGGEANGPELSTSAEICENFLVVSAILII